VEIRSQICDDSVGEAKAVEDVTDEADYLIRGDLCNRLVLDPLCKLVNGHQHMVNPPGAVVKGPIMSRPQQAKGQDSGMVMRLSARTCACLPKN
jgi:hypothetical protein